MNKVFKYSFDDEPVNKFSYDFYNKKLEIYFSGYYENESLIEKPCIFIIQDWQDAKSRNGNEEKFCLLNNQLGIISMILHMQIENNILTMLVNTLDNRYLELCFKEAKLSLE